MVGATVCRPVFLEQLKEILYPHLATSGNLAHASMIVWADLARCARTLCLISPIPPSSALGAAPPANAFGQKLPVKVASRARHFRPLTRALQHALLLRIAEVVFR